ncbi:MAG: MFS transporter [Methanobacteriota archaeon]|nr:MAG: MFS transporter [Euryarchaeota archaeon]
MIHTDPSASHQTMEGARRGTIGALAALVFVCMFNLTFIVPSIKELIIDRFDATTTEASLFVTVEMVAYIIFAMIWGSISDRHGERHRFIVAGLVGSAALYYLMTLAPDLVTMLSLRFVQGAMTVMSWSLIMTVALDTADRGSYGASMGVIGTGLALGLGIGAPVGGFVGDIDPLLPLHIAAMLFAIAAVAAWLFVRDAPVLSRTESIARAIALALGERRVLPPYLFGFFERFSAGFLVLLFPLFMADAFGSSPQERGMFLGAFLLPFALLQYPFGRLSDLKGRNVMLVGGGISYAALFGMLGLFPWGIVLVAMIVCGVFAAMLLPASMALLGSVAGEEEKGTYMGGFNAMGSLGFAIGPFLAAVLADSFGYEAAFISGGLVIAAMVLVSGYLLLYRRDGPKAS